MGVVVDRQQVRVHENPSLPNSPVLPYPSTPKNHRLDFRFFKNRVDFMILIRHLRCQGEATLRWMEVEAGFKCRIVNIWMKLPEGFIYFHKLEGLSVRFQ